MENKNYIEYIKETPADADSVLTDEELAEGGLVKVNAFVRTKASSNALRIQKHREKKENEGIKQINVQTTEEAREVIKAIADRTKQGESLNKVLHEMAGTPKAEPTTEQCVLMQIGNQVKNLTGWKKLLVSYLLK